MAAKLQNIKKELVSGEKIQIFVLDSTIANYA